MPTTPFRRSSDPRQAAETAFKSATTKSADPAERPKTITLPPMRELVSLRIDQDVLEHFQAEGPGWQERINAALRAAAGIPKPDPQSEGLHPNKPKNGNDG